MGSKMIKGSLELAKSIKQRRNELNLTIEEAALKAEIGTKTWSRYESGESIRMDKCGGICKSLNWHEFPTKGECDASNTLDINEYTNHEAWSPYILNEFGKVAAASFVIGSDILLDHLQEDIESLSSMPRGSHVGEIDVSWLKTLLPPQFLMRYDYDFLFILNDTVSRLRLFASIGEPIVAHSVLEELTLYLIVEESRFLMEDLETDIECDDTEEAYTSWDEWIFDIFEDMDVVTFLYSYGYLTNDSPYHFEHWLERQFFC